MIAREENTTKRKGESPGESPWKGLEDKKQKRDGRGSERGI